MRLAAVWVVGLVCSLAVAAEPVQRTLSFEERVKAQTAIERVYYSHQVGATKSFDAAVPKAVIEAKVRKYLEQSAALNLYWKTPVTDYSLQRELERMAQGTRMPERLQELHAALGNDAFLVKECLARATLVDRLTRSFYAFDPVMHAAQRGQIDELHRLLTTGELSAAADHPRRTVSALVVDPSKQQPQLDSQPTQERLTPDELKQRRAELPGSVGQVSDVKETRDLFTVSVILSETATELRVANYVVPKIAWETWWTTARTPLSSGSVTAVASGRVDFPVPRQTHPSDPLQSCSDDYWDNGGLGQVISPRMMHSATWTGSLMLVWGGSSSSGIPLGGDGGRYDPATDSWSSLSNVGAPSPRVRHSAVWTGNVMVIWGGAFDQSGQDCVNTGGRYDPATDTWRPTSQTGAPVPRSGHTAVWSGSRMIVWGGYGGVFGGASGNLASLNSGGQYDPDTDLWTPTTTTGAPTARVGHTGVWTGSRMLIWGGGSGSTNGARYDPATNTWAPIAAFPLSYSRYQYAAVWALDAFVVWGGLELQGYDDGGFPDYEYVNTGARYDPRTDSWTPTSTVDAPSPRGGAYAVAAGNLMLVWGGDHGGTGARYDLATDSWKPTSLLGAPTAREFSSVVWTGSAMVIWGGVTGGFPRIPTDTGSRYDPSSDTWTPTGVTMAGPPGRTSHSAIWTGSLMVVWGGRGAGPLYDGGRYDPATDSWTPTSLTGAPSPRYGHGAVWTGDLMVVWGNTNDSSGGRYDPLTDSWSPTSTTGAPAPRSGASAVWTGRQMIVWGGWFYDGLYRYLDTGGRYDPASDTWLPTAVAGAPSGRDHHTAVWTGSRMVVWGGSDTDFYTRRLNTGGRYDPESDTWSPTSLTDAPDPRNEHTAIWTGSRMVVWGGDFFSPGGRYDPEADVWTPVAIPFAPIAFTGHSAVWTGSLMVIWGGSSPQYTVDPTTGARYDPVNDHWLAINKAHAPPGLYRHTAVWTGDMMLAWGNGTGGRYSLGTRIGDDCDGDGFSEAAGDCDDHAAAVYPGAPQICDGVNDDCNSPNWPYFPYPYDQELDRDNDGVRGCGDDCDDFHPTVYPGAPQLCDGLDNNCADPDWPIPPADEADADHDQVRLCGGDCDDSNRAVGPGFWEYCDGLDNDCDNQVDEGAAVNCYDYDPCTDDVCAGAAGCTNPYNASPCEDNNDCTSNDVCSNGYCQGTPTSGSACNDYNPCTNDDTCVNGICTGGTLVDCDDGDICDGVEYCQPYYGCYSYGSLYCNDQNSCTDDSCDPVIGCVHTVNDDNVCSDSDACTNGDRCVDGFCQSGTTVVCDDSNPCTTDSCSRYAGCVFSNNFNGCSDGDACTDGDYCANGFCHSGSPNACDDDNPCTQDSCTATGTCVHVVLTGSCDDGNFCTLADTCVDGVCVGGTLFDCNDNNPCTSDRCDPYQGCVLEDDPNRCNDQNPCTSDICDPNSGGCTFVNNAAECDDGNACTSGDICDGGACHPGSPTVCNDGTVCTTDSCDPVTGCFFTGNTNSCDDGNACTTDDVCAPASEAWIFAENFDGVAAPALPAGWTSLAQGIGSPWVTRSDDGDSPPNSAFLLESNRPADAILDSPAMVINSSQATLTFRNRWSYEDTYTCWDGGVLEIKIGTSAFVDIVDAGGQFVEGGYSDMIFFGSRNPLAYRYAWCHVSPGYPGFITTTVKLPATAAGKSIQLRWRAGSDSAVAAIGQDIDSIVVTDPANACISGSALDCNDHDPCTDDSCDPSTGCVHSAGVAECDDGNDCTDDLCRPVTGCSHVDRAGGCNDGDPCTIGDACVAGVCGGVPNNCNDADPCTTDSCAPGIGCRHEPFGGPCDDGNVCTTNDVCSGGVCDGTPLSGGPCDDGNACTTDGICFQGGCYPGPSIVCDDANVCTTDSCDPAIGCVFSNNPVACDDGNQCTDDLCSPVTGCSHVDRAGGCDDGDPCTIGDACTAGTCSGGGANNCSDGDPCTADTCAPGIGCQHESFDGPCDDGNVCTTSDVCSGGVCDGAPLSGGACNDGNACTTDGTCFQGGCYPGPSIVCDDANACTTDSCDPATGCVFTNNTTSCDDGSVCTTGDRCGGGRCNGGQAITCSDGNVCTTDSCDSIAGCLFVNNTVACDDLDACTTGDICGGGNCQAGVAVACDDNNACTTNACDPVTGCYFTNRTGACDDGNPCTTNDACGPPVGGHFLVENFDAVTPPTLPAGWTTSVFGSGHSWATRGGSGESAPNFLSGIESDQISDAVLESPAFLITSTAAMLTFRNRWSFDDPNGCYDASVLEIKIGGGSFEDILSSGGTFVSGGYTGTVASEYGNPLAHRSAWCNTSAGYPDFLTTEVKLPAAAAGQSIKLRWRLGSDSSITYTGQDIDSIEVRDQINGCNGGPAPDCNDNNPCTDDSCDPTTGCVHANNSNACDDGNACTQLDSCSIGACVGAIPVICPAADQCHTGGACDPATGACTNTPAPDGTACDDNNVCTTGETCRAGACTSASSGLNEPNPRSNGYYKSLCHGPHSGDALTDADAVCVASVAHAFAGISTVADLCAELEPSHPNSDACDRADDDLMVLALNICRARVCTAQSIDSQCGGNATVGQSLAESDAILSSASRTAVTCARAKCLDEEINTGGALELNSLTLSYEKAGVRLRWSPPYLNDGTGHPTGYHVWRRAQGSLLPFRMIAETSETTFLDTGSGAETFAYEVTAVMP